MFKPYTIRIASLAAAIFSVIFLVDLSLPLGVAGAVPYVAVVLLGWWFGSPRVIFLLATIASILTILGYFYSSASGIHWVVLTNRGLALFAIWIVALLIATALRSSMRFRTFEKMQSERLSARLGRFIEYSANEIYVFEAQTLKFVQVNRSARENLGYTSDQLRLLSALDLMHEFSQESFEKFVKPLREGTKVRLLFETPHRRKDGSTYPAETYLQLMSAEEPPVFLCSTQDITERIKAEAAMRDREARFETILCTATEAIVTIDENGVIDLFNPAAEAMFGYGANEVAGKNVEILMSQNYESKHSISLARYLRTGETTVIGTGREVKGRRKDGSIFPVDLALAEWKMDGKTHFTGSMRDLTARVRMEGRLREAQKMAALGRLSGAVAHEFTNLLLPIIALTKSSIDDLHKNDKVVAKLKKVLRTAEHCGSIINQIMDFSRQRSADRSTVVLADVVGEEIALLKVTLPPQIEMLFCADGFDEIVLADPMEIRQIVSNLGINAVKAIGKEAGKIEFRLQQLEVSKTHQKAPKDLKPGRYALLTVSDTGCGMDEDILSKIFEPFFTTRPKGEGTGMGLSIVHAIVAGHEGAISAKSRPGEGATFDIRLPLRELPVHDEKSSCDGLAQDDRRSATGALAVGKERSGAETPAVDEMGAEITTDTAPALE